MTNRDDYFDPRYRERRNPYFEQLLKEGANTSPIGAHSQGLSRLAFALLAGLEARDQDARARAYFAGLQQPQPPRD
jgi:hypothetical protein